MDAIVVPEFDGSAPETLAVVDCQGLHEYDAVDVQMQALSGESDDALVERLMLPLVSSTAAGLDSGIGECFDPPQSRLSF